MALAACHPGPDATVAELADAVAVFFPDDGDYRQAALVCAACPVRAECLDHVAVVRPTHGWWAGRPQERGLAPRSIRACQRCGLAVRATDPGAVLAPDARWCSRACAELDARGVPLLHVDHRGDPLPQARPA